VSSLACPPGLVPLTCPWDVPWACSLGLFPGPVPWGCSLGGIPGVPRRPAPPALANLPWRTPAAAWAAARALPASRASPIAAMGFHSMVAERWLDGPRPAPWRGV